MAAGQTGVLSGLVTSDSAGRIPLGDATVEVLGLGRTYRTSWTGEYRIAELPAGVYLVTARGPGRKTVADSIRVTATGDSFHDFVLFESAAVLPAVITKATPEKRNYISPLLRGFEDRRASGFGNFIPEETLRKSEDRKLTNVLTVYAPGARFVRKSSTSMLYAGRAATRLKVPKEIPQLCYTTIYLDGVLRYDLSLMPTEMPPNIDDFAITDLAGVEYYAGEASIPNGFRQSGCGLLLLWTRER